MLARALLAAVAVLVLVWVGILERDYRVGHAAALRLFEPGKASPARVKDTSDRLRSAEFLSPDTRWQLARARYYINHGYRRESARTADSLVRREPENIDAWYAVYLAARKAQPRRALEAANRIKRLDPLVGR